MTSFGEGRCENVAVEHPHTVHEADRHHHDEVAINIFSLRLNYILTILFTIVLMAMSDVNSIVFIEVSDINYFIDALHYF